MRFTLHPPTGKQIHINEMSIYRIVDGKIVEQWLIPDMLSLNQQLRFISEKGSEPYSLLSAASISNQPNAITVDQYEF